MPGAETSTLARTEMASDDLRSPDLIQNMWVNSGEALAWIGDRNGDGVTDLRDADADEDGILTFVDLNDPSLAGVCPASRNPNLPEDVCDPLDLVDGDSTVNVGFENGLDDDGNGLTDDLVGWDFADSDNNPHSVTAYHGHGTFVAAAAAAVGDNGPGGSRAIVNEPGGLAGVNWIARVLPLRESTDIYNALRALSHATGNYRADVAVFSGSVSLSPRAPAPGAPMFCPFIRPPELGLSEWRTKLECLWGLNTRGCTTLVIAPTTNCGENDDADDVLTFPAEFHGASTISMTGLRLDGSLLPNSNYGAESIDIGVVGEGVLTLVPDGTVDPEPVPSSVSAALGPLAGAAALIVAAEPAWRWKPCALRRRLMENADAVVTPSGTVSGDGLLNIEAAVRNFREPPTPLEECPDDARCRYGCLQLGGGGGWWW